MSKIYVVDQSHAARQQVVFSIDSAVSRCDGRTTIFEIGVVPVTAHITAGIDLALSLIEEDLGRAAARTLARQLVPFHPRPGGQMEFSPLLRLDPDSDRIRRVMTFMRENLGHSLTLVRHVDMTNLNVRQFGRAFFTATGTTPANLMERLCVESAKLRIEDARTTLDLIARSVGFTEADRMRLAFLHVIGQTPRALRNEGPLSNFKDPVTRCNQPHGRTRSEQHLN